MDLEMVFNELSIDSPASSVLEARQWMDRFIETVTAATKAGVNRVLRTHIDLNHTLLAPEYPLARWRNDDNIDVEIRRYFRSITSKFPPLEDLPEIGNDMLAQDFFCMDRRSYGFGIAHLLESLAVSLPSEEIWDEHLIDINTQWLEENGDLVSQKVRIPHASQFTHVDRLSGWISKRLKTGIENGTDLWKRKALLFPHLIFCDHAAHHVRPLKKGNPIFRQIVKRLFELETYCLSWSAEKFSPEQLPFKATIESESTLRQYGDERTSTCPNGNRVTFTWHGRMTPGAWRIYFDPKAGPGFIHIGYIGPKLPTVTDPT